MLSAVPPEMIAPALQKAGFRVEFGKSLSELGTFQLGGPLQALVCCEDPRQLEILRGLLHREGLPALLIGEGSNLLFSDAGWPGLMVRYVSENCRPEAVGSGLWKVSASVSLQELVSWSVREGWAGLEAFSGIPGTLGGAVVGNAGAWGVQMEHVVFEVRGVDSGGTTHLLSNAECGFRYRDSLLKDGELWISEVLLQLRPGDAADLTRERERILEVRAAKHPDWRKEPCIGSFFKNLEPSSAAQRRQAAGFFLEQAGAKSCQIGGAGVYPGHANILIKKTPDCRADDVAALARTLQQAVNDRFGLELQREVRYLGILKGEESGEGFY